MMATVCVRQAWAREGEPGHRVQVPYNTNKTSERANQKRNIEKVYNRTIVFLTLSRSTCFFFKHRAFCKISREKEKSIYHFPKNPLLRIPPPGSTVLIP